MLAHLHDSYRASIHETGMTRRRAAQTLLVVAGGKPQAFVRQARKSGLKIERDRIEQVMQAATRVAQKALAGLPPPNDLSQATSDIAWLADILSKANCINSVSVPVPSAKTAPPDNPKEDAFLEESFDKIVIVIAVAALGLVFAVFAYRRSRRYRQNVVQRMPRKPFSAELDLTFTDVRGDMRQAKVIAMDLSVGGMKLNWPQNDVPPGTTVTVALPTGNRLGSVMWSNAHYAGIMFDEHLTSNDLKSIESPVPDERETAPEGAA